ncbi:MAG: DMT family transporter [Clostridiales bacterium]|nr:DMT family transporter [Candidatus Cacconaster stercorequi]
MNSKIRQILFPLLAALIWGTAFVAQSISTDYIEPMTFNAIRSVVAFVVLLLILRLFRRVQAAKSPSTPLPSLGTRRDLILASLCCGAALALASNLQQAGIAYTSVGKAGFITALYIVLVPVFGLFFKKKVALPIWISVLLAVGGLYCLCISEHFTITRGDFLVLLCSVLFAVHILLIDHFTQKVNGIALSCGQFLVAAILSGIGMLIFEHPSLSAILTCVGPILYVGIFSSGVAYTLQILAQKDGNPTVVCLLLSMESVFSTLSGAIILHEVLSGREYFGCVLMLTAVILSQIPFPTRRKTTV